MAKKLVSTEAALGWLERRFRNQQKAWLAGEGVWPLEVPLGVPSEAELLADMAAAQAWGAEWAGWRGPGRVEFVARKFSRIGEQKLPLKLVLSTPEDVASALSQATQWARACARRDELMARWPAASLEAVCRHFDVMAEYSETDFERLLATLTWFMANPASQLTIRQLPICGVDTKWLETRTSLVADLLCLLRDMEPLGFHEAAGVAKAAHRIRLRVLCPELRRQVGGLRDIEAPLEDLAELALAPKVALVVENKETGVALPDMPGAVVFLRLGYAVSVLGKIPWVRDVPAVYWGDIDTHGLAILARARKVLPSAQSVLMDESTLLRHHHLTVVEGSPHAPGDLENLTASEQDLFNGLQEHRWGVKLRLEQERLPWAESVEHVREAVALALTEMAEPA